MIPYYMDRSLHFDKCAALLRTMQCVRGHRPWRRHPAPIPVSSGHGTGSRRTDHALWIDGVDPVHWPGWRKLLESLATAARSLPEHRRPVLCVPVAASEVPLTPDLLLDMHAWVGRVREFDMLLYVASLLGNDTLNPRHHALRLALIAELAGTDPALALALMNCKFAQLLDAAGLISQFPALASHGLEAVTRRIWLAQVRQLFPLLEAHRLAIIDRLNDRLRRAYEQHKDKLTPIAEREDDHRALGIGDICYLLCQCEHIDHDRREHLQSLRSARNRLAHQQPVPEALLERVLAKPL
ncbi:hypothetical protein [Plasticicumulans sp.]|uniref:hypothetical protein n=1 Tax=Plasticicumulans sp. TaxID=2307179 RepID=UPI00321FAEFB